MKEKLKQKAIKQFEALGVNKKHIKEFLENDKLYCTDSSEEFHLKLEKYSHEINSIQEKYNCIFYCALPFYCLGMPLITLLFVDSQVPILRVKKRNVKRYITYAYVIDEYCPKFSEFGSVEIINENGLIYRIN
ncbi:hypothetical protein PMY56_03610 [Clostridium tertium]|uniref:hypothetical protein n=1 Tax=Clostridium tertium TaxID=1559 RepID=UPI0023309EC3|nr:hypothetical protein [Clostridium tertium]MDB1921086.1 hypothetical protein [Clostridium tertium]MDB1925216.1 hypothetical protein [Clostridium tertium]MDB1930302.1 hypothetical protein [Clostridium tertium]